MIDPTQHRIVLVSHCLSLLSSTLEITMEIIKTFRGGKKLVLDNETYTIKNRRAGAQIRWSCSKAKQGGVKVPSLQVTPQI